MVKYCPYEKPVRCICSNVDACNKVKSNTCVLRVTARANQPKTNRVEETMTSATNVESETLTDEQVANWRTYLSLQFGGWALIMPREQVQLYRDRLQQALDEHSVVKSERG
jgi:hypothetical protein